MVCNKELVSSINNIILKNNDANSDFPFALIFHLTLGLGFDLHEETIQ